MSHPRLFRRFPTAFLAAPALLAGLTLTAATAPAPAASATAVPTVIILDGSGSMLERAGGVPKIESARRAVRELVAGLPDGTPLGLVVYSHRKPRACDDFEVVIPAGPLDRAKFIAAVDAIKPQGNTPLAAALRFTADALDFTKRPANIVLVSDGVETCGGDPCATALDLQKRAAKLTVHVVAFDLSAKQAQSFECIAVTTSGRFLPANDAASLTDALATAVQEAAAAAPPPAEKLGDATVQPPAEVAAGAQFKVTWTGPDNAGDYLTIVPAGTPDGNFENYTYTRQGSPLELTAPIDAGSAEVRYVTARSRTVLARAAVKVTPIAITLDAPASATAGAVVPVAWKGPGNRGDYLTIVPAGTADTEYGNYAYTGAGGTENVAAPMAAGAAEIRYVSGQGRRILARRPIAIAAAEVSLDAPAEATAGSRVSVAWTGPNNRGDYVTIVTAGAADNRYGAYAETRTGSPLQIAAPMEDGAAEVRYVSGQGAKVLARRPLTVVAAQVTLAAAPAAVIGSTVEVTWTGPDNRGDFITLVPAGAPDNRSGAYTYTDRGSPLKITATLTPGEHELRYISGAGAKVLARRALRLDPAKIEMKVPAQAPAGSTVEVTWTGPDNVGDFVTIVPQGTPDGTSLRYAYTRTGSPLKVGTPPTPGPAEVRYMSSQGNTVLARAPIEIVAAAKAP